MAEDLEQFGPEELRHLRTLVLAFKEQVTEISHDILEGQANLDAARESYRCCSASLAAAEERFAGAVARINVAREAADSTATYLGFADQIPAAGEPHRSFFCQYPGSQPVDSEVGAEAGDPSPGIELFRSHLETRRALQQSGDGTGTMDPAMYSLFSDSAELDEAEDARSTPLRGDLDYDTDDGGASGSEIHSPGGTAVGFRPHHGLCAGFIGLYDDPAGVGDQQQRDEDMPPKLASTSKGPPWRGTMVEAGSTAVRGQGQAPTTRPKQIRGSAGASSAGVRSPRPGPKKRPRDSS